ncbi:DNA methyltransferase [Longimycelium tulufanense]|uniref:DNA methyltransferase n=1 Tax=Longimycelium tulufanense TaxID=907463 RepID=A0A8J3CLU5_9PSEU|nr:DNA adenine methylase [Longimycelium tulufanense]GGM85011.1 DNA methyltransferase [Longimycelium tulufanense]
MKPPFAYYGGKTGLARRIVDLLPPHQHYVEPFAGSLAVLLAKPPAPMETVNDLDGDLMHFWRVLRDRPAELIRACALTPHSRAEYQTAYKLAEDELERARRVWVRISQGRTGTLARTGWRFYIDPAGSSTSMPGYLAGYVERMASAAQRLARVSLECRPALELIEAYGSCPDVLLYVDPPYLGQTRTGTNYRHEMSSEREHRKLAEALKGCRAAVVLSGYHSPLYAELYRDWHVTSLASATAQGGTWSPRTEALWSNRPPQGSLFDHVEVAS